MALTRIVLPRALCGRLLRDVVRCFRFKLEQPDPHVQLLALQARAEGGAAREAACAKRPHSPPSRSQALDACFKACGHAFHDMMATKDLLDVVVRIVVTETLQARRALALAGLRALPDSGAPASRRAVRRRSARHGSRAGAVVGALDAAAGVPGSFR